MLAQWENGNKKDVLNYIFGACRKAQLVAFAIALPKPEAERLIRMLDREEVE